MQRKVAWAGVCALVLSTISVGIAQPASAETYTSIRASNAYVEWSIPNSPSAGLTNITFPVTVNIDTRQTWSTFYAHQFAFTGVPISSPSNPMYPSIGYIGLQPREQAFGHQRLRAKFSSFVAGSTSTDESCVDGVDGGPGVDCIVDFDGVYGHEYALTVAQTGPDTWTGTAKDTVTGVITRIGSYVLPAASGKLGSREHGFVEYFTNAEDCVSVAALDVEFGAPTSTDAGGLSGATEPSEDQPEDENCPNPYTVSTTDTSVRFTRNTVPWRTVTGAITGVAHGKCLDVTSSKTADGTPIQLYRCNKTKAQRWTLAPDHTIRALGKCLDATGSTTKNGTPVQLMTCSGSESQQWIYTTGHLLLNVHSGRCLDFEGDKGVDRAPVQMWAYNHWVDQRWTIPTA